MPSQKRILPGPVAADFDEIALVLQYTVETTNVDSNGEVSAPQRKQHKKRVRLKALDEDTDCRVLAEQITSKCSQYLGDNQYSEVLKQLQNLQMHRMQSSLADTATMRSLVTDPAKIPSIGISNHQSIKEDSKHDSPRGISPQGKTNDETRTGLSSRPVLNSSSGTAVEQNKHSSHSANIQQNIAESKDAEASVTENVGHGTAQQIATSVKQEDKNQLSAAQRKKELATFEKKWRLECAGRAEARLAAQKDADVDCIEDYLEHLYDESLDTKINAARHILALIRDPVNLASVVASDALLGAMARVLRDEYQKDLELTTCLVQIFFCMSHFEQLHDILVSYRVGDACMRIADLEHHRHEARVIDLRRVTRLAQAQAEGDEDTERKLRKEDADIRRLALEAKAKAKAKTSGKLSKKSKKSRDKSKKALDMREASDEDDLSSSQEDTENKTPEGSHDTKKVPLDDTLHSTKQRSKTSRPKAEELPSPSTGKGGSAQAITGIKDMAKIAQLKLKSLPDGTVDISKERLRFRLLMRRQERLLFVTYHTLLNLAHDEGLQRKMCNRGIIELLSGLLERPNPDLLMLSTTFLRRLSEYAEHKDEMLQKGVIQRSVKLASLPEHQQLLSISSLRLMFNLSFDPHACREMISHGLLASCAPLLRLPPFRAIVLRLLYNISFITEGRTSMAHAADGEIVSLILRLVANFPQPNLPPELLALLINLSTDDDCAKILLTYDAPRILIQRAERHNDWIILKAARHLADYSFRVQCWYIQCAEMDIEQLKRCIESSENDQEVTEAEIQLRRKRIQAFRRKQKREGKENVSRSHKQGVNHEDSLSDSDLSEAERELHNSQANEKDDQINVWDQFDYPYASLWSSQYRTLLKFLRLNVQEVLVETLAILSRLTPRDLPDGISLSDVLSTQGMVPLIERHVQPELTDDDIILETVQLLQTFAADPDCADLLAQSDVGNLLAELLVEKAADAELVTQTIETVYRMLMHTATRRVCMYESSAVQRLIEFALHKHSGVRKMVARVLEIVVDCDRTADDSLGTKDIPAGSLWRSAQTKRFQAHNREWCAQESGNPALYGIDSGKDSLYARHLAHSRHGVHTLDHTDDWTDSEYSQSPGETGYHGQYSHHMYNGSYDDEDSTGDVSAFGFSPASKKGNAFGAVQMADVRALANQAALHEQQQMLYEQEQQHSPSYGTVRPGLDLSPGMPYDVRDTGMYSSHERKTPIPSQWHEDETDIGSSVRYTNGISPSKALYDAVYDEIGQQNMPPFWEDVASMRAAGTMNLQGNFGQETGINERESNLYA